MWVSYKQIPVEAGGRGNNPVGGTGDANVCLVSTSHLLLLVPRSENHSCLWVSGVRRNLGPWWGAPSFSSRTESIVGDRTTANGRILPEGQRRPCRPCVYLRQDLILAGPNPRSVLSPKSLWTKAQVFEVSCVQPGCSSLRHSHGWQGSSPPLGQFAFSLGHMGS